MELFRYPGTINKKHTARTPGTIQRAEYSGLQVLYTSRRFRYHTELEVVDL